MKTPVKMTQFFKSGHERQFQATYYPRIGEEQSPATKLVKIPENEVEKIIRSD